MEPSNVYTFIAQKQTELQNELYDEWKRKHQLYCCNPDWMISGGRIQWNAIDVCEMSKTSWQTGNSVWTKIWPFFPFGALVEYLPDSEKDQAGIYQFGKNVSPGIFPGWALIAGRIWKGDILMADVEELEKLDASEIYPRRLNAKEVLITHKDGEFVFLVADGSATLSGRDCEFQEPTLRREFTVRRESQRRISRR